MSQQIGGITEHARTSSPLKRCLGEASCQQPNCADARSSSGERVERGVTDHPRLFVLQIKTAKGQLDQSGVRLVVLYIVPQATASTRPRTFRSPW